MKLVRGKVDPSLPPGKCAVGGVHIVKLGDDEALGRELRTVEVSCPTPLALEILRRKIEADPELEWAT